MSFVAQLELVKARADCSRKIGELKARIEEPDGKLLVCQPRNPSERERAEGWISFHRSACLFMIPCPDLHGLASFVAQFGRA